MMVIINESHTTIWKKITRGLLWVSFSKCMQDLQNSQTHTLQILKYLYNTNTLMPGCLNIKNSADTEMFVVTNTWGCSTYMLLTADKGLRTKKRKKASIRVAVN